MRRGFPVPSELKDFLPPLPTVHALSVRKTGAVELTSTRLQEKQEAMLFSSNGGFILSSPLVKVHSVHSVLCTGLCKPKCK